MVGMFDAKKAVVGVVALAVFGVFLVQFGQLDPVVRAAEAVLPEPKPAPEGFGEAPDIVFELPEVIEDGFAEPGAPPSTRTLLDGIPVLPPATADYDRDVFGPRWADVDRNGCDTRNDILARDLVDETFREGTNNCVVMSGNFIDPYTGAVARFAKADAAAVPIDHVVALSWAWQNGAYAWNEAQLVRFANDPLNLQATLRSVNSSKSDDGPSGWMPPNTAYRCDYVKRFVAIVVAYELGMQELDRATLKRELVNC